MTGYHYCYAVLRLWSHRSTLHTVFAIRFALRHRRHSTASTLHHLNVVGGREQIVKRLLTSVYSILLCDHSLMNKIFTVCWFGFHVDLVFMFVSCLFLTPPIIFVWLKAFYFESIQNVKFLSTLTSFLKSNLVFCVHFKNQNQNKMEQILKHNFLWLWPS